MVTSFCYFALISDTFAVGLVSGAVFSDSLMSAESSSSSESAAAREAICSWLSLIKII